MQAWNSEIHFLYVDVNGTGLLPVEAENQGKLVDHDRARRRRPRAGAGARARVERADERAAPRRRARGRGRRGSDPPAPILDGRDPRNYVIVDEDGHLRRAARAGRGRAGGRSRRAAVVPRSDRPRADRAARAARRRARGHPLDPGGRGRRLASSSSASRSRLPRCCEHGARAETFASVRKHRNYRLYFGGQAVSFTGTWVQQIAASWLVLQLTHSPVAVGALALTQLLPVTVLGLFVGTILDRYDVRRVALVTETSALVIAAVLATLTLTGVDRGLGDLRARARAGHRPGGRRACAARARLPDGRPEDLANAVALNSSLGTLARILGPAIGGVDRRLRGRRRRVLRSTRRASWPSCSRCSRSTSRSCTGRSATTARRVVGGALDALRFVKHSPRAGVAFFGVLVLSTFCFNFNVLLPLVADRTLRSGAQTFGLIAAVFGAGALCGAVTNAVRGQASLRLLLIGAAGYGVFELVLAPQRSLVPVCLLPLRDRLLLHAVGNERALRDPARGAGAPPRPRGEPLLLRVPRRRAARRPLRRLAELCRRHASSRSTWRGRSPCSTARARDRAARGDDVVVADQPVSDEARAAVELHREHAALARAARARPGRGRRRRCSSPARRRRSAARARCARA